MDQLLRESHIISLHVPLTPQSHHLINKDALAIMKQVHALTIGHGLPRWWRQAGRLGGD